MWLLFALGVLGNICLLAMPVLHITDGTVSLTRFPSIFTNFFNLKLCFSWLHNTANIKLLILNYSPMEDICPDKTRKLHPKQMWKLFHIINF